MSLTHSPVAIVCVVETVGRCKVAALIRAAGSFHRPHTLQLKAALEQRFTAYNNLRSILEQRFPSTAGRVGECMLTALEL